MNATPKRIQRKRTKGWKMPPDAVYVGRPSKWGNPFKVGDRGAFMGEPWFIPDRSAAVGMYRANLGTLMRDALKIPGDDTIRRELAGKDLACWCPLDQPCHADVLLELANGDHR